MESIKYLLLILLASCFSVLAAQESAPGTDISKTIDETSYNKVKNQLDLTKTKNALRLKEFKPKEKKKKESKDLFSIFKDLQNMGIFQILSYILIIGLVSFLIYLIFSKINVEKKFELSTENISIDDMEDIQMLDTDVLLRDALAKEDFRTAVRIKFLAILKRLSKQEKINWRREKTNRDYSRELRKETYGNQFKELAYIFDHVWYGKQQLTKSHYEHIDGQFSSFSNIMNG